MPESAESSGLGVQPLRSNPNHAPSKTAKRLRRSIMPQEEQRTQAFEKILVQAIATCGKALGDRFFVGILEG